MPLKDAGGSGFEAKEESYKVSYLTAVEVELSYPGTALKRWRKALDSRLKGRKEAPAAEAVMGGTAAGIPVSGPPFHPAQHTVLPARESLCDPAPRACTTVQSLLHKPRARSDKSTAGLHLLGTRAPFVF